MVEIAILRSGRQVHRVPLEGVVHIGRAPHNDLVLADDGISRAHATVWIHDGRVWLRDNGSTNGSFLDGRRVEGALPIDDGDRVRLGKNVELALRGAPDAERAPTEERIVEDASSGVVFPLALGLNTVGGGDDDDVQIDGLPPRSALLLVGVDGSIRLGDQALAPDATSRSPGDR